jgi:hypothetical protein
VIYAFDAADTVDMSDQSTGFATVSLDAADVVELSDTVTGAFVLLRPVPSPFSSMIHAAAQR